MHEQGLPPAWLMIPASAVLADLVGSQTIRELQIIATVMTEDVNGLSLGLAESAQGFDGLPQLDDDLDPELPTEFGGGNWVPRSMTGAALLVHIAELLQEDLAETSLAWGDARPPCPHHPHPARAVIRDDEAWWVCSQNQEPLYRVGLGEVPRRILHAPTGHRSESRRAWKRRHH
jgi:hypothetical protein